MPNHDRGGTIQKRIRGYGGRDTASCVSTPLPTSPRLFCRTLLPPTVRLRLTVPNDSSATRFLSPSVAKEAAVVLAEMAQALRDDKKWS
jgi:hypothetical protein